MLTRESEACRFKAGPGSCSADQTITDRLSHPLLAAPYPNRDSILATRSSHHVSIDYCFIMIIAAILVGITSRGSAPPPFSRHRHRLCLRRRRPDWQFARVTDHPWTICQVAADGGENRGRNWRNRAGYQNILRTRRLCWLRKKKCCTVSRHGNNELK